MSFIINPLNNLLLDIVLLGVVVLLGNNLRHTEDPFNPVLLQTIIDRHEFLEGLEVHGDLVYVGLLSEGFDQIFSDLS